MPTPFARRGGKFPVKRKRQMHTAEPVIDVLLMLACMTLWSAHSVAADSAIPAIRQYVTKTRHWQPSAYRIERKEQEGRCIIYYVIAFADEHQRTPVTGAGQSFAVYYEPRAQQIVREMHFQ